MRTLCLPITKETLRLQGLTKLDQLVSSMMYSPFRAQKRMDEWSKGWPAHWRTAEERVKVGSGRRSRWGQRSRSLTLPVDTQHGGSVVGMQVKENRGADQVLGEISEERNRPEGEQ